MMLRVLLGCLLLTLSLPTLGRSEQDLAKQAYMAGDYKTAHDEWLKRATQNNTEAQFNLGYLFENGQGVPVDLFSAARWYELAARQNYPGADHMLKQIRSKILASEKESIKKWLPKANKGDPASQLALAEILAAGRIVKKNNIEALKWLLLSLENAEPGTIKKRMLRFEANLREQMAFPDVKEVYSRIEAWKALRE